MLKSVKGMNLLRTEGDVIVNEYLVSVDEGVKQVCFLQEHASDEGAVSEAYKRYRVRLVDIVSVCWLPCRAREGCPVTLLSAYLAIVLVNGSVEHDVVLATTDEKAVELAEAAWGSGLLTVRRIVSTTSVYTGEK